MKKVSIGILLTLSVFAFAFDFLNGSFEVANDISHLPHVSNQK